MTAGVISSASVISGLPDRRPFGISDQQIIGGDTGDGGGGGNGTDCCDEGHDRS